MQPISLTLTTLRTKLSWVPTKDGQCVNPTFLPQMFDSECMAIARASQLHFRVFKFRLLEGGTGRLPLRHTQQITANSFAFHLKFNIYLSSLSRIKCLSSILLEKYQISFFVCYSRFFSSIKAPAHHQSHLLFPFKLLIGDTLNNN